MQYRRIEAIDGTDRRQARTSRQRQDDRVDSVRWTLKHLQGRDLNFALNKSDDDGKDDPGEYDEDVSVYSRVRLISKQLMAWNLLSCSSYLEIASDGLRVSYDGPVHDEGLNHRGCAVRADRALSLLPGNDVCPYFEVKIQKIGPRK